MQRVQPDNANLAIAATHPLHDPFSVARVGTEGRIAILAYVPVDEQDELGRSRFERAEHLIFAEGHELGRHQIDHLQR